MNSTSPCPRWPTTRAGSRCWKTRDNAALLADTLGKIDRESHRAASGAPPARVLPRRRLRLESLTAAELVEEGLAPARRRAERAGIALRWTCTAPCRNSWPIACRWHGAAQPAGERHRSDRERRPENPGNRITVRRLTATACASACATAVRRGPDMPSACSTPSPPASRRDGPGLRSAVPWCRHTAANSGSTVSVPPLLFTLRYDHERTHHHIVDDDDAVRDSLALLLNFRGFAAALCQRRRLPGAWSPDWRGCLLLDLRMGAMDGLALQQALTTRLRLPVCSSPPRRHRPCPRRAQGRCRRFLEKPYARRPAGTVREAVARDAGNMRNTPIRGNRRTHGAPSERERQVMTCGGRKAEREMRSAEISPRTVEVFKARMMEKMQARSLRNGAHVMESRVAT